MSDHTETLAEVDAVLRELDRDCYIADEEVITALRKARALIPDPPTDDEREDLATTIGANRTWAKRMSDGYMSTGQNDDYAIADSVFAAGFRRHAPSPVTDAEVEAGAEAALIPLANGLGITFQVRAALEAARKVQP